MNFNNYGCLEFPASFLNAAPFSHHPRSPPSLRLRRGGGCDEPVGRARMSARIAAAGARGDVGDE